jgi:hypothetical protein
LGEGIEKESLSFAEEVAAQTGQKAVAEAPPEAVKAEEVAPEKSEKSGKKKK